MYTSDLQVLSILAELDGARADVWGVACALSERVKGPVSVQQLTSSLDSLRCGRLVEISAYDTTAAQAQVPARYELTAAGRAALEPVTAA